MKKAMRLAAALFLLLFLLSGCSYTSTGIDSMLKPPTLSDQQSQIYTALQASVGKNIRLKYPRKGDFISAFLINDMDEEPSQEALVFYELASSTPGTSVRINILDQKDGRWISTYDAVVPASEVEKVSLIAVDRRKYLVIGFNQLGSPNKIILIYSYEDGRLEKKFQTTCSNYEVMDLDGDKQTELVTISAEDGEEQMRTVTAEFRRITSFGCSGLLSSTALDPEVTRYSNILRGKLLDGRSALYLDGIRGGSTLTTEILVINGPDRLENLMYEPEQGEDNLVRRTMRDTGSPAVDLDNDGVVEIPVRDPGKNSTEPFTEWYLYLGGALSRTKTTYAAYSLGYLFILPERWRGRVTAEFSTNDSELIFYEYTPDQPSQEKKLLSIRVYRRGIYEREAEKKGYRLLWDNGQILYAYQIYETSSELGISEQQVAENFQRYTNSR